MKISDRLRLVREHFSLTQPEAATKFGIPLGTYKQYEKGPSEPGAGALRALAEGGVNINWLLTGEGEMLLADQACAIEKNASFPIDTIEFERIFQRLLKKDFIGHGFNERTIAYFTVLIYNRIMSEPVKERRNEKLETAIKELGLILLDQSIDNLKPAFSFVQQNYPNMPDELNKIIKEYDNINSEHIVALGSLRGRFAGRTLGPGGLLESEFMKGIALSEDSA